MLRFFFFVVALSAPFWLPAQTTEATVMTRQKLKIVVQLTTNDTVVQRSLARQLNNMLLAAPKAEIEVVCFNNGITFLQQGVTRQADKIKALQDRGIRFVACENTLRERKIARESILPAVGTVQAGVVEIALKQQQKWSYIKAGF